MTYRDTKINDTIYILDKDKMVLQQGRVTATSPHVNNTYNTMAAGQMMRDIAIEVDGKNATYTIPENLSVTFAGSIVLATSQQGLSSEIERMKSEAEQALAMMEHHKMVIDRSSGLLAELNPHVREKMENERRFKSIESDMSGIKTMMQQLLDKLS